MGGVFRAPKIQQRVVPVVDTEAEAKKRAEKENPHFSSTRTDRMFSSNNCA